MIDVKDVPDNSTDAAVLGHLAACAGRKVDAEVIAEVAALLATRKPQPHVAYWEGPYTDADELWRNVKQGDVVIDDVGTLRQVRYGDTYMSAGFTQYGCGPLTARELVADGKRPAWILRTIQPTASEPVEAEVEAATDAVRESMESRQGGLTPNLAAGPRTWGEPDAYWITMHAEPAARAALRAARGVSNG